MNTRTLAVSILAVSASALMALPAAATEGYFQHGYGARSKALAGAGVADSADATAPANNPAGLVNAGDQIDFAFSLFSPRRSFKGTGGFGFTPLGEHDSGSEYFPMPNMAVSYKLDADSAIGLMVIGNGGMNTDWSAMPRNFTTGPCIDPGTGLPRPFARGTYCNGKAGVNLGQVLIGATYARRMGPVSFGLTPMLAVQWFKAQGLGAFAGSSNSPTNLTGNQHDWSYGGGFRGGMQFDVTDRIRLGIAGQTPMWMTKLDDYSGLFANGGEFDIPPSATIGVAFDATPDVTVMFDYQRIWYSSVDAIANPSRNILTCPPGGGAPGCLGGSNGAGFGWEDVDIFKVAVEWNATQELTLRAGYAYNTQPIDGRDAMFNILAPGVIQHHITGGLKYDINERNSFELAGAFMPKTTVHGRELPPPFGAGAGHGVDLSMSQFDITASWTYRFGDLTPSVALDDEPIIRKY
ncbi:long-chain fatty acid transport protein [Rhodobium orientis]|uniref:Hydrocarbon degradation protein n=1 Tax=Rhodobium orientis TaxID=34017 RepID=A0A327JK78_9HYPH|nr:outer membrane protein transport protein [Rhodobium orientis]MBB4301901.1 long-chain fatty acid transport protein [Rhodobium orientis]MBK5950139.1 hypothetical protein [Rhodobium orientis]RAI25693.1 hypothetical protein CH339_17200 [Rhodobium orientis]